MIFRYRELIFGYWDICLISQYREINSRYRKIATREASHSGPLQYRLTTPAPINNGPPGHTNPSSACSVHVGTVITTSVIHSAHDTHAMEN